ncbi:MAG TPA: permease prefix domain 1-containing protein [Gammaproteobacteria bacterium]|nr:permease prefix domain 1-containing protein [Gammaproteobacteria bacterium]
MSDDPVREYIDELGRALRSRGTFDAGLLTEMRDHLIDATEKGVRRGLPAAVARREAIARFGTPDCVAAEVAAETPRWERRALLVLCTLTLLASAYLSLSLLILRPPGADFGEWFVQAALFFAQGAATIVVLNGGGSRSAWNRGLLTAGAIVIAFVGGKSLYGAGTGHFDGYSLVLGALLSAQGLVTIMHFQRRTRPFAREFR